MMDVDEYPLIYIMTELPMYHPAVFAEQQLYEWGKFLDQKCQEVHWLLRGSFGFSTAFYDFEEIHKKIEHPDFDNIIRIKEYSEEEAYDLISEYLKVHKTVYPSELSHYLQMDYELVCQIIKELEGEKRVKEFLQKLKEKGETEFNLLDVLLIIAGENVVKLEDNDLAEKILQRLKKC